MEGDVLVVDDWSGHLVRWKVDLPAESRVRQGERLFRLRRGKRMLDVRAPLSGTVLSCNAALRSRPELINDEPFARGWVVRLRSDHVREDQRRLLHGKKARTWFRFAVDRVVGLLSEKKATAGVTDQGVLRGSLYQHIDDVTWHQLTDTMFAVQPNEPPAQP
jgi:glycine cleavage system H lipoate-binding protein